MIFNRVCERERESASIDDVWVVTVILKHRDVLEEVTVNGDVAEEKATEYVGCYLYRCDHDHDPCNYLKMENIN